MVAAIPALAWGTTWPGPTDSEPLRTLWGSPGAVTGHSIYNNNNKYRKHSTLERPYGAPAAGSGIADGTNGGSSHRGHPGCRAGDGGGPRGALGGTCARREAR